MHLVWLFRRSAIRIRSRSEEETSQIARAFAAELPGGAVVLLFGELGSGKTAFVRGLLEGVGGKPEDVSSPTFTLMQEYTGDPPIVHVDLYRLSAPEIDDLGLDEVMSSSALVAVEWADRLTMGIPEAFCVYIEDNGADEREIRIETPELPIRSGS